MERNVAARKGGKRRSNPSAPDASTPTTGGSRKRTARPDGDEQEITSPQKAMEKKTSEHKAGEEETEDNLQYEDPFPDSSEDEDIEEEDEMVEEGRELEEGLEEEDDEEGEGTIREGGFELVDEDDEEEEDDKPKKVWRPDVNQLGADEVLDYDSTTYDMMHPLNVEWPCLSFDILLDKEGYERTKFPHTMYLAAGTQADRAANNKILVMKCSQLHRTTHDDDEDADDNDDDLDDDPIIEFKTVKHNGAVNRIRSLRSKPEIVATWSDTGAVHIWNLRTLIRSLDVPPTQRLAPINPEFTFKGHRTEGFAMDWSATKEGRFLSGDCDRFIYLYDAHEGHWTADTTPFTGHSASVEDLQWSPSEVEVFASCSVDKTIKIWDARMKARPGLSVDAHNSDVNVISWNKKVNYLMLSGADDGTFSIWDLRNFKSHQPAAHFKWHKGAITSIEWHPTEESVLAVSGDDNQVTTWDMSLEADAESAAEGGELDDASSIPPQLLFVHMGQQEIKEIHWHPQIPGTIVSTAASGFNIYKSFNV